MNLRRLHPQIKESFEKMDRVAYIPTHAAGNVKHKDVEWGYVSSINKSYIFVKFDKQLTNLGWDETTAQSCLPQDLVNFGASNSKSQAEKTETKAKKHISITQDSIINNELVQEILQELIDEERANGRS